MGESRRTDGWPARVTSLGNPSPSEPVPGDQSRHARYSDISACEVYRVLWMVCIIYVNVWMETLSMWVYEMCIYILRLQQTI